MCIPPWGIFLWRSYVELNKMCTWLDWSMQQLQASKFLKVDLPIYHCDLQSWTWINILAAPIWPSQLGQLCWKVLRFVQRHQLDEETPDSNRLSRLWLPTRLRAREGWGQLHGQDTKVVMVQFRSYNIVFFQAWYCHAGVHESKVMKSTRTLFANLQISKHWQQTKSIFSSAYLHIETEKLVGQWYYGRFYTLRPRTVQGFNLGRDSATFLYMRYAMHLGQTMSNKCCSIFLAQCTAGLKLHKIDLFHPLTRVR